MVLSFKRSCISMAVAIGLICTTYSINPMAEASTVNVKGDTQVQMYGFIRTMFSWNTQMEASPDHSNIPLPNATSKSSLSYKSSYDKTTFDTDSDWTRIGFKFKNSDSGLLGRVEADFAHSSTLRLRRAFVKHTFGNYYVLIGKDWVLEDTPFPSIDPAVKKPAGFYEIVQRVPQVQLGLKLDFGTARLGFAVAFEDGADKALEDGANQENALKVSRIVMPYFATKVELAFQTNFGSPAKTYIWASVIPARLSDATISDKSETSYAFGTGVKVPVYAVTVGTNYQYAKGAVGYAGVVSAKEYWAPASYYDIGGSIEKTTFDAFNLNITFFPASHMGIGGEYDCVQFKNSKAFGGLKPKVSTYLANVRIKVTRCTRLTFEYRYVRVKNFNSIGADDNDYSGDQIYALYMYRF